jgi:hypothetical protein
MFGNGDEDWASPLSFRVLAASGRRYLAGITPLDAGPAGGESTYCDMGTD